MNQDSLHQVSALKFKLFSSKETSVVSIIEFHSTILPFLWADDVRVYGDLGFMATNVIFSHLY